MMENFASNEARKKRRKARRAKFIQMLGGKCVRCGSKNDLQFDHIKKKHKTLDIANSIDTNEDKLLKEIKKCQLLCKPCHVEKSKEAWDWSVDKPRHGTLWMYKKYKCRCDKCKDAVSKYYYTKKLAEEFFNAALKLIK